MDQRLIEAGFPCHQVGAETPQDRNEDGQSAAMPIALGLPWVVPLFGTVARP
jgi:hypothetical protein